MEFIELLKNEYLSLIFGGIGGVLTAWLTQRVLNKRGVFTYFVNHQKIGTSTEDAVFGSVSVTWNGNPIQHLYLSTITLKNESLNDYENIIIRTYTASTVLLNESTKIVDTPYVLEWSDKFKEQMFVPQNQEPTKNQADIFSGQREYLVPVLNRGDVITISYLNSAKTEQMPNIWLSASQKGVKIKFRTPQNLIFGIPQTLAAFSGVILGLILLVPIVMLIQNNWLIALIAISYGFIAQIPGAYLIKFYQKCIDLIGG